MNFNNWIADVVNKLNMGNRHRVRTVVLDINKKTMEIIYVLLDLGLIRGFKLESVNKVKVQFRFNGGFHIFYKLKIVSKPSKRVFWNLDELYKNVDKKNSEIYILSTKEGLLIGSDCLWRNLTGEVLLKIVL